MTVTMGGPGSLTLARCPDSFLYTLAVWAGVTYPRRMSKDDLRALIGPHAPGVWRGTKAAILAAIERYLPKPFDPEIYGESVLADGPVAYYRLGDSPGAATVADAVAGLDATVTGAQVPNLLQGIAAWPSFESPNTNPNLCPYPGMEALTGWQGGGVANPVTVDASQRYEGANSLRSVSSGAGTQGFPYMDPSNAAYLAPVQPGKPYTGEVYMKADAVYGAGWLAQLYWYDASLTQLASSGASAPFATSKSWARVAIESKVAPATAAYARLVVTRATAAAGEAVNADAAKITLATIPAMTCDGNGTIGYTKSFAAYGTAAAVVTAGNIPGNMDLYGGINRRIPVTPGDVVVFSFYSRAVLTNRPSYAAIQFYRADDTIVSTSNGVDVTDTTTGWVRPSCRAVVPTDAVSALPIARWRNVVEGEQHYCDAGQFTKTDALVPYCDNQALQLGVSGAIPASADTALELQDASGYITVPHPSYLLTPAFSLEMWVWITPGTTHETLWDLAWGAAGHLVRIESSGSVIFFIHTTSNSNDYVNLPTPPGAITGAGWQHIVCTFDTDMIQRVYVDGELAATSAVRTGVYVPPSGALYFGGHYSAVYGRIDEAAIYNYALTPDQVAAHYNSGLRLQVPANPESMIYFEERADGDAYRIRIFTYEHWTLDEDAIRTELLNQIPAGLLLDYEVRVGQTYGMVRDTHPTYTDVKAAYATYADMAAAPPPAAPSE